jgi:hypothetical protein
MQMTAEERLQLWATKVHESYENIQSVPLDLMLSSNILLVAAETNINTLGVLHHRHLGTALYHRYAVELNKIIESNQEKIINFRTAVAILTLNPALSRKACVLQYLESRQIFIKLINKYFFELNDDFFTNIKLPTITELPSFRRQTDALEMCHTIIMSAPERYTVMLRHLITHNPSYLDILPDNEEVLYTIFDKETVKKLAPKITKFRWLDKIPPKLVDKHTYTQIKNQCV